MAFSVILHLISGLYAAKAIADSEGLEIVQTILPVQVDLGMITETLAELKENMKTVMTQIKTTENQINSVQSELEKRLAALEKKILDPICPTIPVTPTNTSVDPITGLK